mmetsp:Transcript_13017/g.20459  ORF Transcript_13017/g.20459 Transcript_13017/m.20459 type:complete len:133 (+) Transcript_13017:153-551(+)
MCSLQKNKTASRAMEKTVRSYNLQPSFLCDLCRQSITFKRVEELEQCLKLISKDPEVAIHRVKNRLELNYNDEASAGYRDVLINLRIVNTATKSLGLDIHVSEVQLLLESYAEKKTDTGHKAYVSLRNLRGE